LAQETRAGWLIRPRASVAAGETKLGRADGLEAWFEIKMTIVWPTA
jgi:hypothetical protein